MSKRDRNRLTAIGIIAFAVLGVISLGKVWTVGLAIGLAIWITRK